MVAEGVETPLAAMALMQHGCHRAQGFLLSRPVAGDAMEALLAARRLPMPFLADLKALPTGAIELHDAAALNEEVVVPSLRTLSCKDADIILVLTEWDNPGMDPEQLASVTESKRIIDARNCLDPQLWRAAGWTYRGFGRRGDDNT